MVNKIIVLHEYGARSHYSALEFACNRNGVVIEYREFRFFYQLLKAIYTKNGTLFLRALSNLRFVISTLLGFSRNSKFVVGIAPFDWRVILIYLMTVRSDFYLHTSWPFWDGHFHPHQSPTIFLKLWSKLMASCKGVFCVTDSVKNGISKKFPFIDESKFHVVYHAIDQNFLDSARRHRSKIRRDNLSTKIIFIGRLDASKGFDIILDFAEANRHNDLKIAAVGSGPLKNDSRIRYINYLGFIKDREELAKEMCNFDFILLPSRKTKDWQELFGMVIIEALACGVYPVVTEHLGPKELIDLTDGKLISEDLSLDDFKALIFDFKSKKINLDRQALINFGEVFSVGEISKKWEPIFNAS
ncbi:TPA: glycosyltransferase [Vibrio vulnificus]|nr:glycosyltransferase [Vibrio vulnificus]